MKSPFKHLISSIPRYRLGRLTKSLFLLFTTVTSQSTILLFAPNNLKINAQTAQVCAVPGKDGPATPAGIINTYYPGTTSAGVGATSITIGASTGVATGITAGDLLLVIQMQDATINSTNTDAYGDGATGDPATGSTPANSGIYEYVVATNSVTTGGGAVTISSGLLNSYNNTNFGTQGQRRFQVVRVPQYSSVPSVNNVIAAPWNGTSGGIVAFDIAGSLNLGGGSINVSGQGFRGGGGRALAGGTGGTGTDYRNLASRNFHGAKGEGIAGTPRFVFNGTGVTDTTVEGYLNGSSGRGAPGNAGGGGTDANPVANDQNSGGGGGSNGGAGGKGGNAWSSAATVGGFGGAGFTNAANKLVLGGGGAGTTNNATGTPVAGVASSGAAGGGIVILRAGTVSGTGTITADGAAANNTVTNDGSGGGGAGGSVLVTAASGTLGTLSVNARGGTGGTNTGGGAPHGPGGGGGSGFVALSSAASTTVSAGTNGTTAGTPSNFGATAGAIGQSGTVTLSQTPGARSGTECIPNLAVTKTTSTPNVTNTATGTTATYDITVSNAIGRSTANNISISDALPAGFTYASAGTVSLTVGATRSTTPVNPTATATNPSFGTFTIPGGGSVRIPFVVNIASSVNPATYQNPATAIYTDPVRSTTAGTATATYNSASSTSEDVTVTSSTRVCRGSNISLLSFQSPTIESGTALQVNTVYRFSNVSPGIDALVKVDSFNNGASLSAIDGTANGSPSAFQPELSPNVATPDSSVDLTITFVNTGTSTPTAISSFHASGVDIDGDSAAIREYIQLSNFARYTLETPTNLTPSYTPPTGRFEAKTTANQAGISLTATSNIATGEYTNVSTFKYRIGTLSASGAIAQTRLNSLYFDCINYTSPVTTIPAPSLPNLLLVKRITAINTIPITTVVDDPDDPNDTNPNWPSGALQGAIAGSVQPQQDIEYTIYFLSTGSSDAVNSRLCDLVPTNTTFVPDAFSGGRGIRHTLGSTSTDFTNVSDADQGRFYTSAETAPSVCRVGSSVNGTVLANVNGAVVVNVGTIPKAISSGNPANSYGFVRFRVKVN